jgi:hypothetical protein
MLRRRHILEKLTVAKIIRPLRKRKIHYHFHYNTPLDSSQLDNQLYSPHIILNALRQTTIYAWLSQVTYFPHGRSSREEWIFIQAHVSLHIVFCNSATNTATEVHARYKADIGRDVSFLLHSHCHDVVSVFVHE